MDDSSSYEQLLSLYGTQESIPYSDLLNCVEWRQKRLIIINRDNWQCRNCTKTGTDSVYSPGQKVIHFYEDFINIEYLDEYGFIKEGVKKVVKQTSTPVYLHVHHTYYILSHKPWEYPDASLETLCSECHTVFHEINRVPVWLDDSSRFMELHLTPCPRCSGVGHFPEHSHVEGGVCFYCRGARYTELMK